MFFGEVAVGIVLGCWQLAFLAPLLDGRCERVELVVVLILEPFPQPREAFTAGGSFIIRSEESLVALLVVLPVSCLALVQHGVAAFADAVVDV